jgi:inorganic pyrophosphatase
MMNYGCFPQTWEDPEFVHPDLAAEKVGGDNDPLDVCEIGSRQIQSGSVRAVKVLGVLCMVDEGEADWKVIAIDAGDPWAPLLDDIADLEREWPNCVSAVREWFRDYKVADGKPQNKFGLNEECKGKEYAMQVVEECNEAWLKLLSGEKTKTENKAIQSLSKQARPSMMQLDATQMASFQRRGRPQMREMDEDTPYLEEGE